MINPRVSVILPVYNRSNMLSRAIDSVLAQTFTSYELIVVDDGSEEPIEPVLQTFSDPRITFEQHQVNRGSAAARNTGLDVSRGKFIAFLDSDDTWRPEKLERQVKFMENAEPNCFGVYCRSTMHAQSPIVTVKKWLKTFLPYRYQHARAGGSELIRELLMLNLNTGGGSNLMVRQQAVHAVGKFDERLPRHTDWELLIRLLEQGEIGFVDRVMTDRYGELNCSVEESLRAKRILFSKHREKIRNLERRNHPVTDRHKLALVKQALKKRHLKHARMLFIDARTIPIKDIPGLVWETVRATMKMVLL